MSSPINNPAYFFHIIIYSRQSCTLVWMSNLKIQPWTRSSPFCNAHTTQTVDIVISKKYRQTLRNLWKKFERFVSAYYIWFKPKSVSNNLLLKFNLWQKWLQSFILIWKPYILSMTNTTVQAVERMYFLSWAYQDKSYFFITFQKFTMHQTFIYRISSYSFLPWMLSSFE